MPVTGATWTVTHTLLPEQVVEGKRLGRHVRHDSRSRFYPVARSAAPPRPVLWTRHIPILDQNGKGACTGNADTGALGCDPLFGTLPAGIVLDETFALGIYSDAEILDGGAGLPAEDNGSSGLSVCTVTQRRGLISGYLHCFSLADMIDALQRGTVLGGINWYDSMDSPDSSGLVTISPSAVVRGGHEILVRGVDPDKQLFYVDNSWGASWGLNGSCTMSYATAERLAAEQGDATVPLPLTQPKPVPAAA